MKAAKHVVGIASLAVVLFAAGCANEGVDPPAADPPSEGESIGQTSSALKSCPTWAGYPGLQEPNSGAANATECANWCLSACGKTQSSFAWTGWPLVGTTCTCS